MQAFNMFSKTKKGGNEIWDPAIWDPLVSI